MGFAFIKLIVDKIVSTTGGYAFRELTTQKAPPVLDALNVDLSALGLPPGTYTITVTATAPNYIESEHSNPEIYTIS